MIIKLANGFAHLMRIRDHRFSGDKIVALVPDEAELLKARLKGTIPEWSDVSMMFNKELFDCGLLRRLENQKKVCAAAHK